MGDTTMSDQTNPTPEADASPSGFFGFTSMGAVRTEVVKSSWVQIPDALWQDLTTAARHFTGRPNTEKVSMDFRNGGGSKALALFMDQVRTYVDRVNGDVARYAPDRNGQHLSATVTPYHIGHPDRDAYRKDPVLKDGKQVTRLDKNGKTVLVWDKILTADACTMRIAWHADSEPDAVDTKTVTVTSIAK